MEKYFFGRRILQTVSASLFLVVALAGCESGNRSAETAASRDYLQHFNPDWAMDKFWEDGLAEVNTYEAEREIYGKTRQFDYTYIVVKEEFNEEYNVKTDDYSREDLFSVMKVNQFARIPTDNYPYHFLTSVFVQRDDPAQVHKLTSSSQEWCGNTFKEFLHEDGQYRYIYHSYWDGEGDGSRDLPATPLFEDQLFYTLRSLRFEEGLRFAAPVYPTVKTSKAALAAPYEATFTVSEDSLEGRQEPVWLVTANLGEGRTNRYWFAKEYPNHMLKQQTWDGRYLLLKATERNDYWVQRQ